MKHQAKGALTAEEERAPEGGLGSVILGAPSTHRLLSSFFLWFIFRIPEGNPKKELLRSLCVVECAAFAWFLRFCYVVPWIFWAGTPLISPPHLPAWLQVQRRLKRRVGGPIGFRV